MKEKTAQSKLVIGLIVLVVVLIGAVAWLAFKPAQTPEPEPAKSASDVLAEQILEASRQSEERAEQAAEAREEYYRSKTNPDVLAIRDMTREEYFDSYGRLDPEDPTDAVVFDYIDALMNRDYSKTTPEEVTADLLGHFADNELYRDINDYRNREGMNEDALKHTEPFLFAPDFEEGLYETASMEGLLTAVGCARLTKKADIFDIFSIWFNNYEAKHGEANKLVLNYAVCPIAGFTQATYPAESGIEAWERQWMDDLAVVYVPEGILHSSWTSRVPDN